ncbi:MAG TPA: ABC transporter ATP-binding protein [Acidimicrobiales bacterium]|nr:ABC transporter ATP-binding protein [Acidimicrobiales bacterium]
MVEAPAFGQAPFDLPSPLLEARSVSISFGGVLALDEASLVVGPGESVGLVGPNGAGKTTLFDCISGRRRPDRGTVKFDGHSLDGLPAFRRARLGMARTFQRIEVFPELTVRDHFLVAERARQGEASLWRDLLNMSSPRAAEVERVDALAALVGVTELLDVPVAALGLGTCRLVELGRALACEPKLLLADEPSSGLDIHETHALADVLRTIQSERGMAVLLVEHDLQMVARTVDRVVVLDLGRVIAEGPFDRVIDDPEVRRAYLGRSA